MPPGLGLRVSLCYTVEDNVYLSYCLTVRDYNEFYCFTVRDYMYLSTGTSQRGSTCFIVSHGLGLPMCILVPHRDSKELHVSKGLTIWDYNTSWFGIDY